MGLYPNQGNSKPERDFYPKNIDTNSGMPNLKRHLRIRHMVEEFLHEDLVK